MTELEGTLKHARGGLAWREKQHRGGSMREGGGMREGERRGYMYMSLWGRRGGEGERRERGGVHEGGREEELHVHAHWRGREGELH